MIRAHATIAIALLLPCAASGSSPRAKTGGVIHAVAVSRPFFHPFASESVRVSGRLSKAGRVDITVVDRDGYPVATIAKEHTISAGPFAFEWDGRHDDKRLVADEAYSFRISWTDGRSRDVYFPANQSAAMNVVDPRYYSRQTATLVYDLPVASRVHIQVGTSARDPKTNQLQGPVLKTVVNREPRTAGRIAESWNGFDESGQIYIPDLPDCVIAIATTPLPENSVITIGNRATSFLEYAAARTGTSLFTYRVASHAHHAGLSALDDVSPKMTLEPLNAQWSDTEKIWTTTDANVKVRVTIEGLSASRFVAQPGQLYEFVNGRLTELGKAARQSPVVIEIPARHFAAGVNTISVNWVTAHGAVAANTLRVRAAPPRTATLKGTR